MHEGRGYIHSDDLLFRLRRSGILAYPADVLFRPILYDNEATNLAYVQTQIHPNQLWKIKIQGCWS